MTLEQFRAETAALPAATTIHVLDPWGEIEDAAFVQKADLEEDDPVRDSFPAGAILITAEAT